MSKSSSRVAFDEQDPFNGNRVRGYLVRTKRRRGDLEITHVNGEACPQYIYGTPSIPHLEATDTLAGFAHAKLYDKVDGTNVLLYRYRDAQGSSFVSYKTRLSPFLREQAYGDFLSLWSEVASRYAGELATLMATPYAFGFELFGSRLRILTDYATPLDARLLYALDPATGKLIDPDASEAWTFPKPAFIAQYSAKVSAADICERVLSHCAEHGDVSSREGAVVYLVNGGFATAYKHKPEAVRRRQACYRELYERGKLAAKTLDAAESVLDELDAYIASRWTFEHQREHARVIEIVREDLGKELEFDAPSTQRAMSDPAAAPGDSRVLWSALWGSHLWGMDHAASDRDRCVVYQVDNSTLLLGAFEPALLEPHRTGSCIKTASGDEHWYELGRVVQLLLKGSLTMLLGVMSPLVLDPPSAARDELCRLLEQHPSRACYRAMLRDVADSERAMQRAQDRAFYLKHLRIACRNLQFGVTLFSEGRYVFEPSAAEQGEELERLRKALHAAYVESRLPERFDARPFHEYVLRWRRQQRG